MPPFKNNLEKNVFLGMLVLVSLALLWVVKPFWGPVFWAIAVTILLYPYQTKYLSRWNEKPNRQALTTLGGGLLVIIIPVIFVGAAFTAEILNILDKVKSGDIDLSHYVNQFKSAVPFVGDWLNKVGLNADNMAEKLKETATENRGSITKYTLYLGQNAFSFIIDLGLMLYLTFFFLRDGPYLMQLMIRAFPLGDRRERGLFAKIVEVIQATIKGNFLVAALQGGLGGVTFWALGITAPLLWGGIMVFASLLPAIGAAIVWVPVALYLLITGAIAKGVILVVIGAGVIGLVDNFLRPLLVGRETGLPDYMIFLATLGGLSMCGLNGFVVGPLIAALFVSVWGIFMREINSVEQGGVEHEDDEVIS